MDNLIEILNAMTKLNNTQQTPTDSIPEEVLKQYPYGEFPSRYTKKGQEEIRINSENRFSGNNQSATNLNHDNANLQSIFPLLQLLANKNNNSLEILTQILFKDNKEMLTLFNLFNNKHKPQTIDSPSNFPNTNTIQINSLKRI